MSRDSVVRAEIKNEIRNVFELEYDWNRSGGLPIRPDVFSLLEWLNPVLCGSDDRLLARLGVPVIELNQDGTVDWFWEYCGRSLCLTFVCDGTVKYLRTLEDDSTSVSGDIRHSDLMSIDFEVSRLIQWVCTGLLYYPKAHTK